jgi:hypothetical protein
MKMRTSISRYGGENPVFDMHILATRGYAVLSQASARAALNSTMKSSRT